MTQIIVADIGGTNARFAIANLEAKELAGGLSARKQFACTKFSGMKELLACYLEQLDGVHLAGACLAIAGPVSGDKVKITNLPWSFSVSELTRSLTLDSVVIVNDFAAKAYAIPHLTEDDLVTLNSGASEPTAPIALVGPGTGLGTGALLPQQQGWLALPAEGGHVGFSPSTREECELVSIIRQTQDYISRETLLSGPGLELLYQAICQRQDLPSTKLSAKDIIEQATSNKASAGYHTLSLFCDMLGSMAGDVVLDLGARQGLYLGGGILPRIPDFFAEQWLLTAVSIQRRDESLHGKYSGTPHHMQGTGSDWTGSMV